MNTGKRVGELIGRKKTLPRKYSTTFACEATLLPQMALCAAAARACLWNSNGPRSRFARLINFSIALEMLNRL